MNYMQQNMTKRWSIKKAPKKNSIQKYSGYERRNFDLGAKFFGVCKRKALNKRSISFQKKNNIYFDHIHTHYHINFSNAY